MKISQASAYALHAMMYMVRHRTQLPVTSRTIAKAEGMPPGYVSKVLQQLAKAGFIRSVRGRNRGYVFARLPEEINLLELFEALEGEPFFDDCPLRHCACGGTSENCRIFSQWISATRRIKEMLEGTSIVSAAWNHPEHRFDVLPHLGAADAANVSQHVSPARAD
ncbi:MAG: Rrf2 family transcriptional regulator [Sedimentisphaerales bacterium]|nr:Rrf2 family transcriptional regulator [Sedimentisphaerales bacterium]